MKKTTRTITERATVRHGLDGGPAPTPSGRSMAPNPFLYAYGNPIMWLDPEGKFNVSTYDKFLTGQIDAEKKNLDTANKSLAKNTAERTSQQQGIDDDNKKIAALDQQRIANNLKRAKATKAELAKIKNTNNKLVNQIAALNTDINTRTEAIKGTRKTAGLDKEIARNEAAIDRANAHIKKLTDLKTSLDTTYSNVSKARGQGDTDIITDIVMNEARDANQKAKLSIAYAHVNFHKGKVELPKTKAEISFFHVGVTEERFAKSGDQETYIGQIVDSLKAADTRLGDLANKSDPTQGATHWFSPQPIGETKV